MTWQKSSLERVKLQLALHLSHAVHSGQWDVTVCFGLLLTYWPPSYISVLHVAHSWAKQAGVVCLCCSQSNTESIYLSRHISEDGSPRHAADLMKLETCVPEFKADWCDGDVVVKGQKWCLLQNGVPACGFCVVLCHLLRILSVMWHFPPIKYVLLCSLKGQFTPK